MKTGTAHKDANVRPSAYTCSDYRQEMLLASLRRRRADPALAEDERKDLEREIERLEKEMGLQ